MYIKRLLILLSLAVSVPVMAEITLQSAESGVFQRPDIELQPGERYYGRSAEVLRDTRQVPAKLGSKFGIRYQVSGKQSSENRVTYLYLTPGVVDPDGTRHDKYVETVELQAEANSHVAAFQFTEDYEVVEGSWQIFVFVDDRLLVKEAFTVGDGVDSKLRQQPATDVLQYRVVRPSR